MAARRGDLRDASAALRIINRRGLGKTRHIDTGRLWVQQTVAQRQLTFNKVLGQVNPADLYTKYLDDATIRKHRGAFVYQFAGGREAEPPKFHLIQLPEHRARQDVALIMDAMDCNKSMTRYSREHIQRALVMTLAKIERRDWCMQPRNAGGKARASCENRTTCGDICCLNWCEGSCISNSGDGCILRSANRLNDTHYATGSGQQVLWGSNRPVKGYNGRATAQLSRPRGSTLIFQSDLALQGVGVSRVQRHGATMRPRGRHLRETGPCCFMGRVQHPNSSRDHVNHQQHKIYNAAAENKPALRITLVRA